MHKLALLAAVAATALTFGAAGAYAQAGGDFATADANKDGAVTFEEAMGQYNTLTQDIFDQADANKDGKLDEGEYGSLQGLVGSASGMTSATTSSTAPAEASSAPATPRRPRPPRSKRPAETRKATLCGVAFCY